MKTKFNSYPLSADWRRAKNHCRTTDNKDFTDKNPSEEFKQKLLISEHSPIRCLEFDWSWNGIPYWVSTEWSRHKFEKFISSQRDDRLKDDIPRGKKSQDAPVNFDGVANMQSLIDAWRKRMCYQATNEARELAEDFRMMIEPMFPSEALVLVPNCVYRGGCPEFHPCGFWKQFCETVENNYGSTAPLLDIERRYKIYAQWFRERHGIVEEPPVPKMSPKPPVKALESLKDFTDYLDKKGIPYDTV